MMTAHRGEKDGLEMFLIKTNPGGERAGQEVNGIPTSPCTSRGTGEGEEAAPSWRETGSEKKSDAIGVCVWGGGE